MQNRNCSTCGKSTGAPSGPSVPTPANIQELYDSGEFELVTYMTYGTSKHVVLSPTKSIAKFNLKSYGIAGTGDIMYIHKNDIANNPSKFRAFEDEEERKLNEDVLFTKWKVVLPEEESVEDEESEPIVEPSSIVELEPEMEEEEEVLDEEADEVKANEYLIFHIEEKDSITLAEYAKKLDIHHLALLNLAKQDDTPYRVVKNGKTTYVYDS